MTFIISKKKGDIHHKREINRTKHDNSMKQKYQYYTLVCSTKFFEQVRMRYINKKLCSLTQRVRKEAEQN